MDWISYVVCVICVEQFKITCTVSNVKRDAKLYVEIKDRKKNRTINSILPNFLCPFNRSIPLCIADFVISYISRP